MNLSPEGKCALPVKTLLFPFLQLLLPEMSFSLNLSLYILKSYLLRAPGEAAQPLRSRL